MDTALSPGLSAMLSQLSPVVESVLRKIQPVLDQPVVRFPYTMPLSAGMVVPPGQQLILTPTDFQYSLEYPFEVHDISLSQDITHTYRDWRIAFQDQSYNQPLQKSITGTLVANLVDLNTGKYCWKYPWTVRPKGGGYQILVTNLDTVNPLTVDISLNGYQLIPR